MPAFKVVIGALALMACLPAQTVQSWVPNVQLVPPIEGAKPRSNLLQPAPPLQGWTARLKGNNLLLSPPPVESFQRQCSVPLLRAPIRNDVNYTLRIKHAPKDTDAAIAAHPPAPPCDESGGPPRLTIRKR